MSFNDGFLFKTVEPILKEEFRDIIKSVSKPAKKKRDLIDIIKSVLRPVKKFDFEKFQETSQDGYDLIFNLINNKSLKSMKWGLNEYDSDFLEVSDSYDSIENFRGIGIYELNKKKFKERLYVEAKQGSIYSKWTVSDRLTETMIHEFIDTAFPSGDSFRIFEFGKWGDYIMGLFLGFILININKGQVTFFAKDDYD